jgi:hypothetical protein
VVRDEFFSPSETAKSNYCPDAHSTRSALCVELTLMLLRAQLEILFAISAATRSEHSQQTQKLK